MAFSPFSPKNKGHYHPAPKVLPLPWRSVNLGAAKIKSHYHPAPKILPLPQRSLNHGAAHVRDFTMTKVSVYSNFKLHICCMLFVEFFLQCLALSILID